MNKHLCEDLGEITIVAARKEPGQPRRKYLRVQYRVNGTVLDTFKQIAGTITGIDDVSTNKSAHEADIEITFSDNIDAKQAEKLLDHLLTRVTRFLDRARRQERDRATGASGFALSGEVTLSEFYGR